MSVSHEHFKSLEALLEALETRETNRVFKSRHELSSKNKDNKNWYGTGSFQESLELIRKGYKEPMEQIKRGIKQVNSQAQHERKKAITGVVGYMPHVPNAIRGLPNSMIMREKQPEKAKMINLVYGFGAIAATSSRDIIQGGIMFLSLVNHLELNGFRVKVDLLKATSVSRKEAETFTVTVKEYRQPLNLLKLCYPLVHPSMLRRTSFRWLETLPTLTNSRYTNGYGTTLITQFGMKHDKEKQFLFDEKILKEGQYYCNVYQCFESKTVEQLMDKIGLK